VNHLSTFLFTKLLMPKMMKDGKSRIIQINSEGHRFSGVKLKDINFKRRIYTGLKGYGQSKTAQLLTTIELVKQLKDSEVTINCCHPGAVKTAIGSNNGFLYRFFFKHVTSHFLKDPIISGKAIYYLAADPELEGISGHFFNLTIDEKPAKHATDTSVSPKVYDLSMQLVGLKDA
jgi:retinol dehydrogenase 13